MSLAATTRNLVGPVMRWGYRLRVHGGHRCPTRGPLLVVAPYRGFWDSTVIATCLPRPVDVLIAPGGLAALGGRLPGRIIVSEDDPGPGLRAGREVLRRGGSVGAWAGDGLERAAGFLVATSGAPVLPVVVVGGSGTHPGDPPAWRSKIDVVVGEPWSPALGSDPLSRQEVVRVAEVIRQRVADLAEHALARTGHKDGVGLDRFDRAPDNGSS
jgi:1-acyl-sn-glycerol-3-phosphate acyltransferase